MQVSRALPVPSRKTVVSLSPSLLTPALLVVGAIGVAIGGPFATAAHERIAALALLTMAVIALGAAVIVVRRVQTGEVALAVAEEQITERDHRQRLLLEATDCSITVIDRDGTITSQNSAITGLIGRYPFEITGQPLRTLFGAENESRIVTWMANAALHGTCLVPRLNLGGIGFADRWIALTFINLLDEPTVAGIVVTARDVSEAVRLEQREEMLRSRDALTDLPNRSEFLKAVARPESSFSLIAIVDLADFGSINREHGEVAGNAILQVVAHRLRQETREGDLLGRLDGDRFAIALTGEAAETHLPILLEAVFERPVTLDAGDISLRAHCGIGIAPANTAAEMLVHAEVALDRARETDSDQPVTWSPVAAEHAAWTPAAADIRVGLQNEEFALHYQPIVTLTSGETREVEALLRWNHPVHGLIGPGDVLPLAEQCDLIQPLTWWTIDEACRQGAIWHQQRPHSPMTISVNLSARMLAEADLAERISLALCRHGFPAQFLRLEIVESTLVDDIDVARDALERLKAIGVQLALDDFGTGFCSLAYLQHFPIDVIKIDRSFVQGMETGTQSVEIVRSIIELARRLHVQTTAEGVETWEQFEQVRGLGSDSAQGYLLARPMAPDRIVLAALDRLVPAAA
jgi:diguanylate cyclase (GGDEF)-like protein/PAS domain S-box-containing protein